MRVRLIPTGQMELLSLAQCLGALFPAHDIETVSARVEPDGRRVPFAGFTSGRLGAGITPDPLRRLVEQLAAEVCPGRHGKPADLAVLIDDLELENLDQVPVVADAVRRTVEGHLLELDRRRGSAWTDRVADALKQRASFHVAVPMIESWLFGDEAALRTAGVPPTRLPARLRAGDPERFETDDAAYSIDDGSSCVGLAERNKRRPRPERPPWTLAERPQLACWRRELHPKAYLSWLCRDPMHERCSTYRESEGGARALASLGWRSVLGAPDHFAWARALVLDLASALGEPAPPFASQGDTRHMPIGDQGPVLRNL